MAILGYPKAKLPRTSLYRQSKNFDSYLPFLVPEGILLSSVDDG